MAPVEINGAVSLVLSSGRYEMGRFPLIPRPPLLMSC